MADPLAPRREGAAMSRPSDAAIARAFWEIHGDNMDGLVDGDSVIEMAAQFDAEAASPVLPSDAVQKARDRVKLWFFRDMTDAQRIDLLVLFGFPAVELRTHGAQVHGLRHVLDALSADDRPTNTHTIPEKVTTSPERVQIPAKSEHDAAALEIGRKAWADVPDAAEWQREIRGTEPAKRICTRPLCRAEMRPGLHCGNPDCGLKP